MSGKSKISVNGLEHKSKRFSSERKTENRRKDKDRQSRRSNTQAEVVENGGKMKVILGKNCPAIQENRYLKWSISPSWVAQLVRASS